MIRLNNRATAGLGKRRAVLIRKMRRKWVGMSAVTCLLASTSAVSAAPLNDELRDLLGSHPQIESAKKSVRSAQEAVNESRAAYFPTVALSGAYGFEHISNPARRSGGDDWDLPRQEAGLSVTQTLFDAARAPAVRSSRFSELSSEIQLENTTQQLMLEAVRAYTDVLKLARLVDIATSNVATIQQQADLEDERVQRGSGISLDVLRAKSRLKDARRRLVEFQRLRDEATAKYAQIFGHEPILSEMQDPEPPLHLLPPTIGEAIAVARIENPSILTGNTDIEIADEARAATRAEYLPTLSVVGAMNYEDDLNLIQGIRRDWSVVLQADWEIFNGFATQARIAQAAADYGAAKDNLAFTGRRVEELIKIAWTELETARERLEILENAVVIAQEVFDSTQQLRESGKETVLNVLDAERDVYLAQLERVLAYYDTKVAVYKLVFGMGRLTIDNLETMADARPTATPAAAGSAGAGTSLDYMAIAGGMTRETTGE